ncbi:helix-turn-helix domain-containing protein [Planctomycetota bacterium]
MYVRDRVALEELERIERKESNAKRARRLRIVILAMQGWTAPAIAMSTGLSRRACQDWVRRFNEAGLRGLEDRVWSK